MTRHEKIEIQNSMHELRLQLKLTIAFGENFGDVERAIKEHVARDHQVGDSGIIFLQEVINHLVAAMRTPNQYTHDDAVLPQVLHLPPLVYDAALPPPPQDDPML